MVFSYWNFAAGASLLGAATSHALFLQQKPYYRSATSTEPLESSLQKTSRYATLFFAFLACFSLDRVNPKYAFACTWLGTLGSYYYWGSHQGEANRYDLLSAVPKANYHKIQRDSVDPEKVYAGYYANLSYLFLALSLISSAKWVWNHHALSRLEITAGQGTSL